MTLLFISQLCQKFNFLGVSKLSYNQIQFYSIHIVHLSKMAKQKQKYYWHTDASQSHLQHQTIELLLSHSQLKILQCKNVKVFKIEFFSWKNIL